MTETFKNFSNRYGLPDLKKKERKEGAREYYTNEGVELLILKTKVFIYCK